MGGGISVATRGYLWTQTSDAEAALDEPADARNGYPVGRQIVSEFDENTN
jgi:hypothetical protein